MGRSRESPGREDHDQPGFAVDLSGRIAVVTGANRGIGRAIALELAKQRATVVCAARSFSDGAAVTGEIVAAGGTALTAEFDVRDEDSIRALTEVIAHEFGKADILVNNAGMGHLEALADVTRETWNDVLETNLAGLFFCSQHLVPLLRRGKSPTIINIGSDQRDRDDAASRGVLRVQGSSSSPHATDGARARRREHPGQLCCPGFVRTDLYDSAIRRSASLDRGPTRAAEGWRAR